MSATTVSFLSLQIVQSLGKCFPPNMTMPESKE